MTPTDISIAQKFKDGNKPLAAWMFFQRWLANPLAVGSITPSGPGLQKLVRKHTHCGPDQIVVEFGGGTGPITKALLDSGIPGERIYTFEIDDHLASYLRRVYPDVNVVHDDCRKVDSLIPKEMVGKVATVVTGIPMLTLPQTVQKEIVDAIFRVLPEDGRFILYTYSLTSPINMKALGLKGTRLGWTPHNIPPASVWGYTKA